MTGKREETLERRGENVTGVKHNPKEKERQGITTEQKFYKQKRERCSIRPLGYWTGGRGGVVQKLPNKKR